MTGSGAPSRTSDAADDLLDALLERCTFPESGTQVDVAFSGGADSTALVALAMRAGLAVTAHHVDHGLRPESIDEARRAETIAEGLGAPFRYHSVRVSPGPNLEARARAARLAALPDGALTGHTTDDQAETVLLRLIRGSGSAGLGAIRPGPTHPMLAVRRSETVAVCDALGIEPVHDPTNDRRDHRRNRIRADVLPLLDAIAERDVVPLLARSAELIRDDSDLIDELAAGVDPTDARAVATAPPALARRALRRWLSVDGYPPDRAAIDRVMAVARGDVLACELAGGRRVERSQQRLRIVDITIV